MTQRLRSAVIAIAIATWVVAFRLIGIQSEFWIGYWVGIMTVVIPTLAVLALLLWHADD